MKIQPVSRRFGGKISLLLVTWAVLVVIGGLFQPAEAAWAVILAAYAIFMTSVLIVGTGWMAVALVTGLWLRLVMLVIDIYTDIPVFSSGGDTENFYNTALAVYTNPQLFGSDLYGGVFPQICGALFWLIGPSRLFIQFTNVLLSVVGLMLIGATMQRLGVSASVGKGVLVVCALMPIPASISAIFLRESLIFCLVAASAYAFAGWLRGGPVWDILLSFGFVAAAATLHLGVLGIAGGYGLALLFYDRQRGSVSLSIGNLIRGVPVIALAVIIVTAFPSLFLEKLERISSAEDAVAIATAGSVGGSAYLTGVHIDNPLSFALFGGLKAFYLLVSPLPMDWRGINDVVSFTLDGLVYLVAIILIVRCIRPRGSRYGRRLLWTVVAGALLASLVLGLGTSAAGTAMRHREKVLPVLAVSVGIALSLRRGELDRSDGAEQEPSEADYVSTDRRA